MKPRKQRVDTGRMSNPRTRKTVSLPEVSRCYLNMRSDPGPRGVPVGTDQSTPEDSHEVLTTRHPVGGTVGSKLSGHLSQETHKVRVQDRMED